MKKILSHQFIILNYPFSIEKIISHPVFSGSMVMIIGSNFANFLAYCYHLVIGRMLGPTSYGELASMISLISLVSVSFGFLGTVIVKFVSSEERKNLGSLYKWFIRFGFYLGGIISFVILIFTPEIAEFLHLNVVIVFFLAPIILSSIFGMIIRAFLQGLLRFGKSVVLANVDMLGRLIFAVILIKTGLSVAGGVAGILISGLLALIIGRAFLGSIRKGTSGKDFLRGKEVFYYALPIFFTSLSTISFFSTDVVLVKHFFNSYDAGIYASLSNLGKIIYFAAVPVSSVMFPMVSQRYQQRKDYRKVFLISLFLTVLISVCILIIYLFLPRFTIQTLYGKGFLDASEHLLLFGMYMTMFTISTFIVNFFLSIGKTKVVVFTLVSALIQALGIYFFHESIRLVVQVSFCSSSLMLISLVIYFLVCKKTKAIN